MGLRFRKSIKIAPGVKVNLNKKSASVSVGVKGFHHTVSSTGRKTTTAGIPGTGLSYTDTSTNTSKTKKSTSQTAKKTEQYDTPNKSKKTSASNAGCAIMLLAIIGIIGLIIDGDFFNAIVGGGVVLIVGLVIFVAGVLKEEKNKHEQ